VLPSITVLTPSFNQAEFLEESIRSVLDQGYPNLEYLVLDGGSTDGSVNLLKRYDGRLRWVSERDGGQGFALNNGFRSTTGEIIGWINSDDRYAEGTLAAVGEFFAGHPDVEWLYGRCPIIDRQGRETKALITFYKEFWQRRYSYHRLLVENFINQPAVFFRRRLLDRVGPIDPTYHCALDYELFLRMGDVARPAFLDRVLAYFRVYGINKMSVFFERSFHEEIRAATSVSRGRHPVLMALHRINRVKLTTAYKLMSALNPA
jgi:glycosyltransferase involved in cell wall biosynthesis